MHSSFCRAVSGYNYEIINLKYHVQYQSLLNSLFDGRPALEAYTRGIFAVLVLLGWEKGSHDIQLNGQIIFEFFFRFHVCRFAICRESGMQDQTISVQADFVSCRLFSSLPKHLIVAPIFVSSCISSCAAES